MEPIFFEPAYKSVIWGGNNISKIFNRNIEGDNIGESWEISAHPNGLSIAKNGIFKNQSLLDIFNNKENKIKIFGTDCRNLKQFPILVKFIDANKNLSIQVHPDNEYANRIEHDSGKNEVWYIMECNEDAKIVYGFKENICKKKLEKAMDNIEESVNIVNVHKGDFISIPAGTIHAILEGIVLCEVQQSSDITYRVYDWNRVDKNGKPRELHKEKAMDVINLENSNKIYNYDGEMSTVTIYEGNEFNIDIVTVNEKIKEESNERSFYVYTVIEGNGIITSRNFTKNIGKGSAFLIPATLGEYEISGNFKMMKIWI